MPRRPRGPLAARLAGSLKITRRRCAGAAALAAALGLPAAVCADAFTSYYGPTAVTTYTSSPYVAGFGAVGPSVTTARPFWDVFGLFERPVSARLAVPNSFAAPAAYAAPVAYARPATFAARPVFPRLARRLAARRAFAAPVVTSYDTPTYETGYYGAFAEPASVTSFSPVTSYSVGAAPATAYYGGTVAAYGDACPPDPCGTTLGYDATNFGPTVGGTVIRGEVVSGGSACDGACPTGDCTSYSFPGGVVPAGGTVIDGGMIEYGPAYAPPLTPTPDRGLPPATPRDGGSPRDGGTGRDDRSRPDRARDSRPRDPRPAGDAFDDPVFEDDPAAPRERSPGGGFGTGDGFPADDFPADDVPNDDFSAGDFGDPGVGGVAPEPGGGLFDGDPSFDPDDGFGEAPDGAGGRSEPFRRPGPAGGGGFDQDFGADPQGRASGYRPGLPEPVAPADPAVAPEPDAAPKPDAAPDGPAPDAGGGAEEQPAEAPASARGTVAPRLATADWLRRTFRRTPADRPPAPGPKVARGRLLPPGAAADSRPAPPGPSASDAARPRLVRN